MWWDCSKESGNIYTGQYLRPTVLIQETPTHLYWENAGSVLYLFSKSL